MFDLFTSESSIMEKIHEKIRELNNGVLNSNNVPNNFTASQCNDMGMLAMELGSYENGLRQSNLNKSKLKEISKSINDIEEKAKAISRL